MLCTAGVVPISEAALAHHVSSGGQRRRRAATAGSGVWGSVGFIVAVTVSGFVLAGGGRRALPAARAPACSALLLARRLPAAAAERAGACRAGGRRARWRCCASRSSPGSSPASSSPCWRTPASTPSIRSTSSSLGYGKAAIGLLWSVGVAVEVAWFCLPGALGEPAVGARLAGAGGGGVGAALRRDRRLRRPCGGAGRRPVAARA